jgi:hypothetical protein
MDNTIVNVIAYLLNMPILLFVVALLIGLYHKMTQVLTAVLAYPVYLAMYSLESIIVKRSPNKDRYLLALNLPKDTKKLITMNLVTSGVVFALAPELLTLFAALKKISKDPVSAVQVFTDATPLLLWSNCTALVFIGILYRMSFLNEIDPRAPQEKIFALSVPSLWKTIIKE